MQGPVRRGSGGTLDKKNTSMLTTKKMLIERRKKEPLKQDQNKTPTLFRDLSRVKSN